MTQALTVTEAQLQAAVIDLAHLCGWLVAHFRPARTQQGWRTPVSADGAGFPDLVMVRGDRLVVAELKAKRGRVSPDQQAWLDAFSQVPSVEVHLWRPSDWDTIEATLTRKDTP